LRFPTTYQVNTRILLQEVSVALGRPVSLDDVPDATLDQFVEHGFSWIWLLGVWQTGEAGLRIARHDPGLRAQLARELPDLRVEDIIGSPFAVTAYEVHRDFGGDAALERLRRRLAQRGLRLLLDFVSNHVALDHPWVFDHPEFLVHGSEEDLSGQPENYARVETRLGPAIVAHGRDPNFAGWRDTVQLNYRHGGLREAQIAALSEISERCDGVRCDMAMLLEPEVIARTWGARAQPADGSPPDDSPFWPAAIAAVRGRRVDFLFVAEVYWDLEWRLQQQGFDFTYDKRLYDRLLAGVASRVRDHLQAAPIFLERSLHFIENHDEPRAAAVFPPAMHRAAAVIALSAPGMRLVHEGQMDGRRTRVSMALGRRDAEPVDHDLRAFYARLLAAISRPEARDGQWRLWTVRAAHEQDHSFEQLIVSTWERGDQRLLVVVNFGPLPGRGTVALSLAGLAGRRWRLADLLADTSIDVEGDALAADFPLELAPWGQQMVVLAPT